MNRTGLRTRVDTCRRGHRWTEANTRVRKDGSRVCRACANRRQREYVSDQWHPRDEPSPAQFMARGEVARCFVCARSEAHVKVIRFGLRFAKRTQRTSAGGIFLCEPCWKEARAVPGRRGPRRPRRCPTSSVPVSRALVVNPTGAKRDSVTHSGQFAVAS